MNIFFNILQKNIKYTGPLQVLKNKDSNRENDFDLEKYKKRIEGYRMINKMYRAMTLGELDRGQRMPRKQVLSEDNKVQSRRIRCRA